MTNPNDFPLQVAGYARASTADQVQSTDVQEQDISEWFEKAKRKYDRPLEYLGCFADKDTSSRIDFIDRPAFNAMIPLLRRGDIIVASKFNRVFRSPGDCERTSEVLARFGVRIVFMDLDVDLSGANGRMLASMMAVMARYERDLRSETTQEALQYQRAIGVPAGNAFYGWTIETKESQGRTVKRFIPDVTERHRAIAARQMMRDGMSELDVEREFHRYHRRHKKISRSARSWVMVAARACLGFPQLSDRQIKADLKIPIERITYVRSPEEVHERDIDRCQELVRKVQYIKYQRLDECQGLDNQNPS